MNLGGIKASKNCCFVCGVIFNSLDEMKNHILEKHEEGQDFIICGRCGYPVRDVKLHFKVKHPGINIPEKGMLKPVIIRDFGEKKTRGRVGKKPKFREGYFQSEKCGRDFYYRSGMECEILECLEQIPGVVKWDYESIEIPYFFEGKLHKYIPDFIITYSTGEIEIIECKPSKQTDLPKNKAKAAAAEEYCRARGWSYNYLTEVVLNKLKLKLKKGFNNN
jgi:hypothetical protein